ncbi:MAG: hypothetical protein AAGH78_10530 [Cyanobacteria bacterium P01_H01_bin.58]
MPLKQYQAQTVRVNRRRLYAIAGQQYPGVTTILSTTKPAAARMALNQWRQRVGAETAKQISGQASSVGTRLHKQIAAHLQGQSVDIPSDVSPYWDSMQAVLGDVEEALLVEGAVWHRAGYVGFPDALAIYAGKVYVCDWKTALKPKRIDWIEDYCLQVTAYAQAVEQVYSSQGIQVEGALIAIALADQPAQVFTLQPAELADYWQRFQRRLSEYYRRRPRP